MNVEDIEYKTYDVVHPRVTINKNRITLKATKWDDNLKSIISELAIDEYNQYIKYGYSRTIRGRYFIDRIQWDSKHFPEYRRIENGE